jgi:uncharacterized protein YndB with AHSA1/START domain
LADVLSNDCKTQRHILCHTQKVKTTRMITATGKQEHNSQTISDVVSEETLRFTWRCHIFIQR